MIPFFCPKCNEITEEIEGYTWRCRNDHYEFWIRDELSGFEITFCDLNIRMFVWLNAEQCKLEYLDTWKLITFIEKECIADILLDYDALKQKLKTIVNFQ